MIFWPVGYFGLGYWSSGMWAASGQVAAVRPPLSPLLGKPIVITAGQTTGGSSGTGSSYAVQSNTAS